ncbi:MAG: hypothetical protein O6947_06505, partial [Acidobacteria bacterium]|nr:hypothetical protein [Acidobacteriota bacterium]
IVQNEISGYIVHQRDFQALSDRIISLLESEHLRRCIGENARRIVEQQYNPVIMTRAHLRVYSKALAEKRDEKSSRKAHPMKKPVRDGRTSSNGSLIKGSVDTV